MSAVEIGALNRRLVLEAPVETADGAGGVTRGYESAGALWASVERRWREHFTVRIST